MFKYRIVQEKGYFTIEKRNYLFGWRKEYGYYLYNTIEQAEAEIEKRINKKSPTVVGYYKG